MKFKYLLFDLDGTLTDPYEGITKSVQYALSACNINVTEREKLKVFIGPPLHPTFMSEYGLSHSQAEFAVTKYRERFNEKGWLENRLFDGIDELLHDLKKAGYILTLATSKPEFFAFRILEHFDIAKYFDLAVGATLDSARSEKWDIINEIIRKLNLYNKKNELLMIGDRKYDIIGAKKCDIKSMGVYTGYAEENELENAGADFICHSVKDIRHFLLN